MEGGERTGACSWWGGGGSGRCLPPLKIGKKDVVSGNFNLFHLCFTNEVRGGSIHYTCKMEGGGRTGACPWWEGVKGEGPCPPHENEKKKRLSKEILISLTYVLLMKLGGGGSIYYTCKMEGGGGTGACP